jgi:histidine triad (HIT) family protein
MDFCVFCAILEKKIESTFLYENDLAIAIQDKAPKAPVHLLIIPKIHIAAMSEITKAHEMHLLAMSTLVKEIAKTEPDFNLICNNGKKAGQSVMHLHWHFLAKIDLYQALSL